MACHTGIINCLHIKRRIKACISSAWFRREVQQTFPIHLKNSTCDQTVLCEIKIVWEKNLCWHLLDWCSCFLLKLSQYNTKCTVEEDINTWWKDTWTSVFFCFLIHVCFCPYPHTQGRGHDDLDDIFFTGLNASLTVFNFSWYNRSINWDVHFVQPQ